MPSWELFELQPEGYRESVLPRAAGRRLAVEAGSSSGWHRWVGSEGRVLAIDRFGASAPAEALADAFGLTAARVTELARGLLERG